MARPLATSALVLLVSLPAFAAPRPNSIAVVATTVHGASAELALTVEETLASYCANELKLDVVSHDDVAKLVSHDQQLQLAGCETSDCSTLGNVGALLGVEKLLVSTLGRTGDKLSLSVVALDATTGRAVGRATREFQTEAELPDVARDLVHFALKHEERESKGYVRIAASEPGATVVIDGHEYGTTPLQPVRLVQGPHSIRVEKAGFLPQESAVDVLAGKTTELTAKLLAKKEVKVAGAGFLPWAGATAGVAVVAGALSGYFWSQANSEYQDKYLNDPNHTGVPGPITKSDLDRYQADIDFKGNTLAYYGTWTAGVLGGVSVVLFSAYYLAGLGAGGDAPAIAPTPDGLRVSF